MKKQLEILEKKYVEYEIYLDKLESKIRNICDFEARITFCSGDRHLILNEETSNVATLDCLIGRTIKNKLTEEEHLKYCV